MKPSIFILLSIICINAVNSQTDAKSVFYTNRESNPAWLTYRGNDHALYNIIYDEASRLLEQRKKSIDDLITKDDWVLYQNSLYKKLFSGLNNYKRTPLNAKITGKLIRKDFTVEKIIYESHPGFPVTAALFIPNERQKPAPAVIYCSGHSGLGFRNDTYQKVILNLVDKGFIVFAFDPIGQGERSQYVDPVTGVSRYSGSSTEHSYAGVQTLLSGTSLSDYFIWDGVRAIDYLETRMEVDKKRIGITGRSGGGTQSALIGAYDKRVYAAAPENYITSFKRLFQSIGPQDAEQNMYRAIEKGFDHPDYFHLRAPKPTLIITTTNDIFNQQGARETFREAQQSYIAFGDADNIEYAEDFGKHESTKDNREALYAFFQNHLDLSGSNIDKEIETFTIDELNVTGSGQTVTSMNAKTVFDLNKDYFSKKELNPFQLKDKIKKLSGVQFTRQLTNAVYTGKFRKEKIDVEKYFLENTKNDYALPIYVINNDKPQGKVLLWFFPEGKEHIFKSPPLSEYISQGFHVVSSDLPGIGELFDAEFVQERSSKFVDSIPFSYTFGANLVGKSIPGIQAESIDLVVQYIKRKFPNCEIHAVSEGEMSTSLMVYASQNKIFSNIQFSNPLNFDDQFIKSKYYSAREAYSIIPGSLSFFDFKEVSKKLNLFK